MLLSTRMSIKVTDAAFNLAPGLLRPLTFEQSNSLRWKQKPRGLFASFSPLSHQAGKSRALHTIDSSSQKRKLLATGFPRQSFEYQRARRTGSMQIYQTIKLTPTVSSQTNERSLVGGNSPGEYFA